MNPLTHHLSISRPGYNMMLKFASNNLASPIKAVYTWPTMTLGPLAKRTNLALLHSNTTYHTFSSPINLSLTTLLYNQAGSQLLVSRPTMSLLHPSSMIVRHHWTKPFSQPIPTNQYGWTLIMKNMRDFITWMCLNQSLWITIKPSNINVANPYQPCV